MVKLLLLMVLLSLFMLHLLLLLPPLCLDVCLCASESEYGLLTTLSVYVCSINERERQKSARTGRERAKEKNLFNSKKKKGKNEEIAERVSTFN